MRNTNTSLSPLDAAKKIGVDKSTITRAIKAGKLSATRDDDSRYWIEPAELARVFPDAPASVHTSAGASSSTGAALPSNALQSDANPDAEADAHQWVMRLRQELAEMTRLRDAAAEKAEKEEVERERERRQLEGTIDDLRTRLDVSEEERRKTTTQLTALLTDQREKAEAVSAASVKSRRWWHLTG